VPNLSFELWRAQEQHVLSYLLTLVSHDVLVKVVVLPSVADVWKHIEGAFASQSRARVINTCMTLATQEGSSTMVEYISKMKTLADDMASVGKKLDDEEFSSYVLAGLDSEYNSIVSSIAARTEPISFAELYSQLLMRIDWISKTEDNAHLSPRSSIDARTGPISFAELYSQLLAHENRLDLQNGGQCSS
jgi:hypothetical protein